MGVEKKILVVSQDNRFLRTVQRNLSEYDYEVKNTHSRNEDLMRVLVDVVPDLTILDTPLVSMNGIRELIGIRGTLNTPVMMLSTERAKADTVRTLSIASTNSQPFIKPMTFEQLLIQVNKLLNKD